MFRDYVQNKFEEQLKTVNAALDREGAYYLFTLRLVPLVPFSVINAVMGLTRMKLWTYWWVSQLGMLAGTMVFVYAGSRIPDLKTIQEKGFGAVFSPSQFTQILVALALLGFMPLIVKRIFGRSMSVEESS